MKITFTKQESRAIKGIAILMMLWHHCFLSGRFEEYVINFYPLSQSQVVNIASFFKICVSLFTFISGYGLYLSFEKRTYSIGKWIKNRLINTLSGYWVIVVVCWPICMFLGGRLTEVYFKEHSIILGLWNMFIEICGLSKIVGIETLNDDWWYISAAIVFIIISPVFYKLLNTLGSFCVICLCFIIPRLLGGFQGGTHWLSFLLIFCVGMVFAKENLFEH